MICRRHVVYKVALGPVGLLIPLLLLLLLLLMPTSTASRGNVEVLRALMFARKGESACMRVSRRKKTRYRARPAQNPGLWAEQARLQNSVPIKIIISQHEGTSAPL